MRNVEELRLPAGGLSLAARFWPGDGTPVIALHGWLDNANSFVPLAQHLHQPLLAIDIAGHGHSDHRPASSATHYIDHVRDVLAIADAQGWQRFILLGHSMGAGIASLFAATFPERVEKLLLIEGLGPPSTEPQEAPATLRKAIDDMLALPGKKKPLYSEPEQAVQARMHGFGGLDHGSSALLCERGLEQVDGGWSWRADARLRLASSLRLSEAQIEGFLRALSMPTLLIVGEQGMGGNGLFDHRLDWPQQLTLKRLSGRHHLHMENAGAVAAELNTFIDDNHDR